MYVVRRAQDNADISGEPLVMAFLDWEKAFDNVIHSGMHKALKRLGIHEQLLEAIVRLYKKPQFKVIADKGGVEMESAGKRN